MTASQSMNMDAIILAGGRGTRLKPVTDFIPKPLIPINNVPILEWQIRFLKKFKINNIIVCTSYKSEQIENFLRMKENFGLRIKVSIEKKPLGTGGAIKKASKFIRSENFLVLNGDTITNIPINQLKSHQNVIASVKLHTKYGILETKDGFVIKFSEKKEIENIWMNAGIYYLSKSIIKDLPLVGDIEKTTFPKYAEQGKLRLVKFRDVLWYSIDSFKDLEECASALAQNN